MQKQTRTAVYDDFLRLEAYHLTGTARPFPSHFHQYYVIGLVEAGQRILRCKGREHTIRAGNVLLFCPGDSHSCTQQSGTLDYRGLNIGRETMLDLAEDSTGRRELPGFRRCVLNDPEATRCLRSLHRQVMACNGGPEREEALLLLLSLLIRRYGQPLPRRDSERREEVEVACAFMEQHLAERVTLDQLCRAAGLSRSALLRAFVKAKGITPYRYLENIRVGRAKQLLEQGAAPIEAALATGFADQSHFTNYFSRFIGLAPGAYREIFLDKEEG